MKYFSMFSGIGGFELGIERAYESLCDADRSEKRGSEEDQKGEEGQGLLSTQGENTGSSQGSVSAGAPNRIDQRPLCIGYSEIDKYATQIYEQHFKHKNYGDATKIDPRELPEFDLLVGGFPCQAFSIAGKRGGFNDTRGTLFFDIARILKEKRPRLLLLENVKGLLSHDNGRTFKTIISTLTELGYDLQWQVLNSKNFGVPQNRERVFIIGNLRGTSRPQVFPFRGDDELGNPEGEVANTLTANYWKGPAASRTLISKTIRAGGRKSPHGSKQNWDSYEFEGSIRRLTPTECERLQAYPDRWTEGVSDTQRYKTLGNGVTVNVIQAIMEKLIC